MHKHRHSEGGLSAIFAAPLALVIVTLALAISIGQLARCQPKAESSFAKGYQWQIIHLSARQERA